MSLLGVGCTEADTDTNTKTDAGSGPVVLDGFDTGSPSTRCEKNVCTL